MRTAARLKLGFYPLSVAEASRIRNYLHFSDPASVLDPCAGTGAALCAISKDAPAVRYGIELDAYRAAEAGRALDHVIQGSAIDAHAPVESFSLVYLNPPFDFEIGEGRNQRMERIFVEYVYRWLKPAGVLVMILPFDRVYECRGVLTPHFRDKAIYRLTEPEGVKYKQVVVFGVRRTRQERERMNDNGVQQGNRKLLELTRRYEEIPPLPDNPDRIYAVPPSLTAKIDYRGLPLDLIEDLLEKSPAWLQAQRITHAPKTEFFGRPLTPLHKGHVDTIRHVVDFPCKSRRTRLLSSWLHFIVEMFQAICCTDRARSDVSVVAGERQQHHFVFSGGPLLPVAACPANANLFFERSVAFAEIDFNARSGSQVSGSA